MKKLTWTVSSYGTALLRALTAAECRLFAPLFEDVVDGWVLRLEGRWNPPGAGIDAHLPNVQYTPYRLGSGSLPERWAEAWVALRLEDGRILAVHTIAVNDGETSTELAEWYEMPLSAYVNPERMRYCDYVDIRKATYVDLMERMLWFHNTSGSELARPDALLAPRAVLRSQNAANIERLEAMLRTSHEMLQSEAPLFDEYCGQLELEYARDEDSRFVNSVIRLRLCARGEWMGKSHRVMLHLECSFDRAMVDGTPTPALLTMMLEDLFTTSMSGEVLMEGSRILDDTDDARAALAQFETAPVLQALCRSQTIGNLLGSLTWGHLVTPSPRFLA